MAICVASTVPLATLLSNHWRNIQDIPGPVDNALWLHGNLPELLLAHPYGKFEFEWQKQFGSTYRLKGCFFEDLLLISDPAALRFILNNHTLFDLSPTRNLVARTVLGEEGLLALRSGGQAHRRIKNAFSSTFTFSRLQPYIPVMRGIARKATNKLVKTCLDSHSEREQYATVDIYRLLQFVTSDIIGEVGFGHEFNAVETDGADKIVQSHQNVREILQRHIQLSDKLTVCTSVLGSRRTTSAILAEGVLGYLPRTLLNVLLYLPTQTSRTLKSFLKASEEWAAERLAENGQRSNSNDLDKGLIGFIAAASDTHSRERLSRESICRQAPTCLVGGQDTTANTLAFAIYELAKRPTWQDQIRKEISEAQDADLNLDKLEYLNARIKETLRFHPSGPVTERMAFEDTVLPLSQPLTTISGRVITELPVKKGQAIQFGIATCNRDPHVWGPDASCFDPIRWLDGRYNSANLPGIGPYSNLATFVGGARVCLGWRLAVLELQVVLFELLSKLRFNLTAEQEKNVAGSLALTLFPLDISSGKPGLSLLVQPTQAEENGDYIPQNAD
ncbi:cytochrome P450 [Marasmius fiardii PR-910]|nr:cytochrome P450 [Marasmius fiardii PR-910]